MKTRKTHRLLAWTLALVMVLGLFPVPAFATATPGDDGSAVMNEAYANRESLIPVGPSFSVETVLEWTPESDPDAIYSRATVKLADRHGGFVVNPLANPKAKLQLCAMPNSSHDDDSAQGNENFFSYCFNYWQYADSFIYWTGSEEGIIACPTGEFVDAAHTNGVPVVATLGFPWGGGAGYVEQVSSFCQKAEDGTFPVADKLIEVMDYYGFDGYFFNQESYGCSAEIATRLNEMIHYMHKLRPDMLISWYDSMTAGGGVSYQDAVNDSNKLWMEYDSDGTMGVNEFMMNYNWTDAKINTTISTMKSIGRSEFDAFAGFNVQANVYGDRLRDYLLVDEDGLARISLSLYYNNQTITLAKDGEDFHKTELAYYVNKVGDPRQNPVDLNSSEWAGMSRFFADKTVVLDAPFVTDFNTGHGHGYFVEGEQLRTTDWSYQSVQNVLPTWTWIIDSEGSKLSAEYDFTTAWNGGNSLKFFGNLDAGVPNSVMLYSTKVAVEDGMTLGVVSKGGNAKLVAYYGDASTKSYETCERIAYDLTAGTDWTETTVDISAQAGKTLYALGLYIESAEAVSGYQLNLGRLTILDKSRATQSGPASVTLDDILYEDAFHAEARIYWDKVTGASTYQVYKLNGDGSRTFIMETPNTALYIPTLVRAEDETDVTLEVVPVNRNGEIGTGTELVIDWLHDNEASEVVAVEPSVNVNLGVRVTGFSEQGDGAECDKVLDGITGNSSKWWASGAGDWMSIDLGQPRSIKRIRVFHAEAGGESVDLNTDTFTIYYKDGNGSWVQAYKVSGNKAAITDDVLDEPITAQEWKLEINRCGPSPWTAVNIYEWEMYETGFPKSESVPMNFASAINGEGANDTFTLTHVPVGHTVKAYMGETLVGEAVAESSTVTLTGLDFGTADAGRVYYTVTQPGYLESARQSAPFDAENAEVSAPAEDVTFVEFSRDGSVSSSRFDGIYTTMTVDGLDAGDVVYLADGRTSLPVAEGETTAVITGVFVARAGGTLELQVKRSGQRISEAYTVETPVFDEPVASIHLYAYNESGESLTGAQFAIINEAGETVSQMGTTSDSGATAEVPLGTYTIRNTGVPEGYDTCADLLKIVAIEGWVYEMKAQIPTGEEVEPTDPTGPTDPTDPEPTDPEPTDPVVPEDGNVALGAEVIAYNGNNLGGASGPEKLFDGDKADPDNGKWCVDGVNMWVAFDIGTERNFGTMDVYHAEYAGEWTPGEGMLNTTAYEIYTLDTSKVNVDELLALSFSERTTLLQNNDNWILLEAVTGNKEPVTHHELELQNARIFKINVSDTDDTNWGNCVRVYEIEMTALPGTEEPETYTVTVAETVGGTVTANKETAEAGETVTLTVTADEGYTFVEGSLKVNGVAVEGNTFVMPAENVTVTAEFEVNGDDLLALIRAARAEAERAQAAAEAAAQRAEEARLAAEEAAASAAEDKEAAEKAQQKAEEAQAAAEAARLAAEEAAAAAEEANLEAAKSAAEAASEANAAAASAAAAAEAQRLAQEAQYAAEVAQAAAEAAAASSAEDREAAEAAQAAAEEAAAAAEEAAAAADENRLDAAASAADAARSAAEAANAAKAAQVAQENAEEAARVAEAAKADAEEAQRKAEEAIATAGAESEAAKKAQTAAEEARVAAEAAQKAAEEAAAAAETAAEAAKASEVAAAEAAASAAEYARLAAEAYAEILKIKTEMVDMLHEAILAAEEAKKAELSLAKSYALVRLANVETEGVCKFHAAEVDAVITAATEAINAAETPAEVDALAEEALAEIEAILARPCGAEKYTDVKNDDWYHEGVDYVLREGYMVGMSDTVFGANRNLNRAQIVTILYRIAGEPSVEGLTHPFVDVPADQFYTDAVAWAYNEKIVNGMTDTLFGPNTDVNRAQLATFLYRFAGSEKVEADHLSIFVDADQVYDFAVDSLNWAVANGLINGIATTDGLTIQCGTAANRAQVAVILERWLNQ